MQLVYSTANWAIYTIYEEYKYRLNLRFALTELFFFIFAHLSQSRVCVSKVSKRSRGRPGGSLFTSNYIEV